MDEKPTANNGETFLNTKPTANYTVSVLITYAFPKISQYYSSKSTVCVLDKYHKEIIEYFTVNDMNMDKFYTASITKTEFVSSVVHYLNKTQNMRTQNSLKTAVKKLYTILRVHQHINHQKSLSEPIMDAIGDIKFNVLDEQMQRTRARKERSIVRELSRTKSEVILLQESNDILKDVADETRKQLIETEQTKIELHQLLESEKLRISEITDVNKQLSEEKHEILGMNRQLSTEMDEIKDENERLKQLVLALQNSHTNNAQNSLSLSNYYNQTNICDCENDESESDSDTEDDRAQLVHMHNMTDTQFSEFYKNKNIKKEFERKKDKQSIWHKLFGDFKCIPYFD